MAKFRYVGDEPREVSMLPTGDARRVQPDELFDVDDKVAESYECQPQFYELVETAKAPAKAAKRGDE
jgi:hypothetical protein